MRSPASTRTWSSRWVIERTGAFKRTASPSSSATRCAIDPAPPSTMFSCAPPSIENSVLMLPCARARNSRWSSDVSFRSPVNRPRTAISNRSRATGGPDAGALEPPRHRTRVPLRSTLRRPRRVDRDVLGHPIDLRLRQRDGDDRERADLGDQARVPACAPAVDEQVGALDPGLVGGDADLAREPEDRVVRGAQPRAAAVDWRTVGQVVGPDPTADAVTCLDDDHRAAALAQPSGGREPGVPGPDDAHIHIDPLGHGNRTVLVSW